MQVKATRDTVFAAADELAASGRSVSIDAVIAMVGGSKSTVSPLLAEWRDEEDRKHGKICAGEPPERVMSLIKAATVQTWRAALEDAHQRFAGERAAHEAAMGTAEGELEVCHARISDLEEEAGRLTSRATAAETAASRVGPLERALERAKDEVGRLSAELDDAMAEARDQRERAAKAEGRLEDLLKQRGLEAQEAAKPTRGKPAPKAKGTTERVVADDILPFGESVPDAEAEPAPNAMETEPTFNAAF